MALWNPEGVLSLTDTNVKAPNAVAAAAANDLQRHQVVMFGGANDFAGTTLFDTTSIFDGLRWSTPLVTAHPGERRQHAMVYDPVHDRVVLFGGRTKTGVLGDTWLWNGSAWSQPATPVAPTPRAFAAMAFDHARGRVILFGGSDDIKTLDDTWEWDGAAWSRVTTVNAPSTRLGAAFASDRPAWNVGDPQVVGVTATSSLACRLFDHRSAAFRSSCTASDALRSWS